MKFYKNSKNQFILTNTSRLEVVPRGLFIFSPNADGLSFSIKLSNGMDYRPFVDVLATTVQKENNSYYASMVDLYDSVYEFFMREPRDIASTVIYLDANRTDSYIENGTILKPFKTISAAITSITRDSAVIMAPGTVYTITGDVTLPNYKINISGNGSTVTCSGTITIPNPYFVRRDLFVTAANVVYNGFLTGARCIISGGGIIGNIIINSYVEMTNCQCAGGTVTVGSAGQLVISLCTPSSKFLSTGVLIMDRVLLNTGHTDYLVKSTAGTLQMTNCPGIINTTNPTLAISCNNGATSSLPNFITSVNCGPTGLITTGTAMTGVSKVIGVPNGSAIFGIPDMLSSTIMSLGSDALGDRYYRAVTGLLTRVAGNTTTQLKVLSQTGTGSASASPVQTLMPLIPFGAGFKAQFDSLTHATLGVLAMDWQLATVSGLGASGTQAIAWGQDTLASGIVSTAEGYKATASHYGEHAMATGMFANQGDCQFGNVIFRAATSATTATELFLNGTSEVFGLSVSDAYNFRLTLLGKQADGSIATAVYRVVVKRSSGGTVTLGTNTAVEVLVADTNLGTPTFTISADDTAKKLKLEITAANTVATRWTVQGDYIKINF